LPPTRIDGATIERSYVADGCVIEPGARIVNSVIGLRCRIGRNVSIRNSIIMGNDYYESAEDIEKLGPEALPAGIGEGASIDTAIVDKNCRIGPGVQVANTTGAEEGEVGGICSIRDGILVVEKDAVLPSGWHP
jgi:glucose-1-phosphate adenylyltransferase